MRIVANGETMEIAGGVTLSRLLDTMGARLESVAVMLNDEIVHRTELSKRLLSEGDQVEVMTLVRGG